MAAEALQLSDTYHRLLEAVPKPMPLISPLPMVYHSKFTPAHVAMRPDCAAQVRSSDSLFFASATCTEDKLCRVRLGTPTATCHIAHGYVLCKRG